jgi:hypothetical protein
MPALLPGRLRSVGRDGFRLALRPDRQRGQLSAVTQGLDVARGLCHRSRIRRVASLPRIKEQALKRGRST